MPTTGNFWDVTNPKKPFGLFDPDDIIIVPIDFSAWLDEQETTYVSHVFEETVGFIFETISAITGVIRVRIKKDAAQPLLLGKKYGMTCQITSADGQKYSKTLYLKVQHG